MRSSAIVIAVILTVIAMPARAEDEEYRRDSSPKNSITVSHEVEDFRDDSTESWQFTYVQVSHKFENFGSVIFRVNRADRFGRDGYQYEVDAYPKLGKGLYAYINVGVSDDSIFPDRRFGVQLYKSLGRGWEGSLGMRYLDFGESTVLYTGSIGRYWGNWYATLTPYVKSDEPDGTSLSTALELRYYRSSGDDYWTFRGSYGNADDVDTLLETVDKLDKKSISIGRQMRLGRKGTFLKGDLGWSKREYSARVERESVSVEVGLKHRF